MNIHRLFTAILVGGLFLVANGGMTPAQALLAAHDCSYCHEFHGAITYAGLLKASSSETLCLSCHNVAINDTKAAAVHNPLNLASNQSGYITCRECHNPHDNFGGNIKLIGYKYDPQTGQRFAVPTIRVETTVAPIPPYPTYKPVTFQNSTQFNVADAGINGACEVCHSGNHEAGNDCTSCHGHSGQFKATGGSCTSCHTGSGGGAKDVGATSPHLSITVGGPAQDCSACHPLHSGGVLIENKISVGINYIASGRTGFRLGGSATTGSTEAEICWNCHDQNNNNSLADAGDVSEWGTNTGGTYNYGSYAGKSWFSGATWSSANFSYKSGALNAKPGAQARWSSHDTGSTAGTSTEQLHMAGTQNGVVCSYCHDVHDLNRATGDATSGAPYLRGSWRPSGYREDGAPQNGQSWSTGTSVYHAGTTTTTTVPRSSNAENGYGGYQIDQNNGNPNASYSYATNDGLCNLCHTQVSIQTAWAGHKNAVKGFANDTTVPDRNIFSNAVTGRSTLNNRFNPGMAYQGVTNYYTKTWMGGFRETASGAGQGLTQPKVDGQSYGYQAANFLWGTQGTGLTNIDITGSSVNADYHSFSCSKCHTPHASRLPRLMITNCLDVKNNSWDDNSTFLNDARWSNWANLTPASGANGYHQLAYAKSAQNCHRYVDQNGNRVYDAATPFESAGWNTATPW